MIAVNHAPGSGHDLGGLEQLAGLDAVTGQLERWFAVVRAEQARRQAGATITRPAWKNLVFTGGPGTGKSRAAEAVARLYSQLGILTYGHVDEVAAADLAGATSRDTVTLISDAARRADGGILMITGAHAWCELPDRGRHVLRSLYQELTGSRDHRRDELAVILAGHKAPLHELLEASPPLAARFPAIINFPGYTPAGLTAIFTALAAEAGFTLTPDATRKAATVLADADDGRARGNARLAVRLLTEATASQAGRVTSHPQTADPATLSTICAADLPDHLHIPGAPTDDRQPGQYL
jgi:ATPase family protein associated with various cellular activities (AAA)/AAA lid domain-containing protein